MYVSKPQAAYGRVSVRRLDGNRLPYVDNLVNRLVDFDAGWEFLHAAQAAPATDQL